MNYHLPPPIPPVEMESAVAPFTVAKEGRKRHLKGKDEISKIITIFPQHILLQN